jgi:hypothetical protein
MSTLRFLSSIEANFSSFVTTPCLNKNNNNKFFELGFHILIGNFDSGRQVLLEDIEKQMPGQISLGKPSRFAFGGMFVPTTQQAGVQGGTSHTFLLSIYLSCDDSRAVEICIDRAHVRSAGGCHERRERSEREQLHRPHASYWSWSWSSLFKHHLHERDNTSFADPAGCSSYGAPHATCKE